MTHSNLDLVTFWSFREFLVICCPGMPSNLVLTYRICTLYIAPFGAMYSICGHGARWHHVTSIIVLHAPDCDGGVCGNVHHCSCSICRVRQRLWRTGAILAVWYYLVLVTRDDWSLSCLCILMSSFIYGSWTWTTNGDWDIWSPSWLCTYTTLKVNGAKTINK